MPPTIISESSDASTIRPVRKSDRKDSVVNGQYDQLFPMRSMQSLPLPEVTYADRELPVRGITQSMIDGDDGGRRSKSLAMFAAGKR